MQVDLEYLDKILTWLDCQDADGTPFPIEDISNDEEKFLFHAQLIERIQSEDNRLCITNDKKSYFITDALPF